jgi:eukaryotic-like serine/threonine-protein kinase
MSRRSKHLYEFGPFRLDTAEHLLLRDGETVPLPPKAFDLLLVLIEHHGHLLEKDELLKAVWPDTFVEEGNLSYNVSLIRKALGEGENGQRFIETVPKRGYRFVGDVREMEESALPTTEESPGSPDFLKDAEQLADSDLETNPEQDLPSAEDVAFPLAQLPETSDQHSASLVATLERVRRRERLSWIVSAVFALVALISIIGYFRQAPVGVRSIRALIPPPENARLNSGRRNPGQVVVSPDGRHLAFVASTPDGKNFIWVRPLNALTAQPLAGTEGAWSPFWSPDSQWLGFFVESMLKKIKVSGGPALKLSDLASQGETGTWGRDDVILFAEPLRGSVYRVSSSGGTPSAVTELDESQREVHHRFPHFLPDGRHFLYLAQGAERQAAGVYVASLDNQPKKLLLPDQSNVVYGSGHLLFRRDRALMAQPFDTERLELTGDAFSIADHLRVYTNPLGAVFSVSENGVLVYQAGPALVGSQLVWFDRNGKRLGVLGDPAYYRDSDLSLDGKKVAVDIRNNQLDRQDIWLYDVARGLKMRFTSDSAPGAVPLWSPDGSRIIYCSNRKGRFDLYQRAANGAGAEEVLLESNLTKFPTSWSRDGRFVLYFTYGDPKTKADLWVLPMFGERKPFLFLQTEAFEAKGRFSPDGRWITYESYESRQPEVYVTPFPGPGGKEQVSIAGGTEPRWRGDGKELFYLAADNKLMAAEMNIEGSAIEIGAVRPLFETHPAQQGRLSVTADGQRFLVNTLVEEKGSSPITLVVNWTADLKR